MPLLSEVHQPDALSVDGPLRYTLAPYYPALYSGGSTGGSGGSTPSTPSTPSPTVSDGNDYMQAACGMSVDLGMAVQSVTTGSTTLLQPADPSSPQPVIGIVVGRPSPAMAIVQTDGLVTHGLNGLVPGGNYFVGYTGTLQMPPLTGLEYTQLVGQAQSETSLYLANSGQIYRRQTENDGEDQN